MPETRTAGLSPSLASGAAWSLVSGVARSLVSGAARGRAGRRLVTVVVIGIPFIGGQPHRGQAAQMARAGAGRAGAATSRAGRAGKGRTSGARNDTSGAAEELSRRHDRRRY